MWDAAQQSVQPCAQQATQHGADWVATFIGLAGALAGAAVSWFNSASTTAQRMRVYQEASDRVSFWEGWLKARLDAGSSAEETARLQARIKIELSVALEYVEAVIRGEKARAAYHVKRRNLAKVRRWFLLYRPTGGWAWTARIMFFLSLIAIPVYSLDPDPILIGAKKTVLTPYVIFLASIAFAWLFRGISISLEKPNWNDRTGRYIEVDKLRAE